MSQLKVVTLRLKSIKNIQKITKTMKMVSASKFTRAERELRAARPFGYGPRKFYQSSALALNLLDDDKGKAGDKKGEAAAAPAPAPPPPPGDPKEAAAAAAQEKRIYIAITSDRGLCGGVHSGVCRRIRNLFHQTTPEPERARLVCVGDKSRTMLRRLFAPNMLISAKEIGRMPPVFADASGVAGAVADSRYEYDVGDIYYNKFVSAVKYELTIVPFFSKQRVEEAPRLSAFDDVEPDEVESYAEWTLAALLYYAMKESAASEQSARMAAMDNATKNAADMIGKLTLLFNRTRQAVITRELIEIISGAAALK